MDTMSADWNGIEYADDWEGLGCDPEEARDWAMDPMIADQWMRIGESPSEARAWIEIGLDPDTADWWLCRDEDPEDVIDAYRLALADPLYQRFGAPDVSAWVQNGYTLDETVLYIRAGVALAEAAVVPADPRLETIAALRNPPRHELLAARGSR